MKVIVLDTETTNSIDEPIMYDIGWAIIDLTTGETVKTESYAVAEIFLDKSLMTSAYYTEKIPSYWDEIRNGERKLARLATIRKSFLNDCKAYNITEIYAHNARFDYRSCNLTIRYLTSSKNRFFFPYGIKICDTLKMSRAILKNDEAYNDFCHTNNYITKNKQLRFTAEILYRFISNQPDFVEVHKGLADVLIEKEILRYCLMINPDLDGGLWNR